MNLNCTNSFKFFIEKIDYLTDLILLYVFIVSFSRGRCSSTRIIYTGSESLTFLKSHLLIEVTLLHS